KFVIILGVLIVAAVGAYLWAGRAEGPAIQFVKPVKFVGATTPFEIAVGSAGVTPSLVRVFFEQHGERTPLMTFDPRVPATPRATNDDGQAVLDPAGPIRWTRTLSKDAIPGLKSGPAKIVVVASRPVLFGIRYAESTATHDVQVRLERPRVSIV